MATINDVLNWNPEVISDYETRLIFQEAQNQLKILQGEVKLLEIKYEDIRATADHLTLDRDGWRQQYNELLAKPKTNPLDDLIKDYVENNIESILPNEYISKLIEDAVDETVASSIRDAVNDNASLVEDAVRDIVENMSIEIRDIRIN